MEVDIKKMSPDEQKSFVKNLDAIEEACKHFRGEFIHAVTKMEEIFDWIIAIYFCKKDDVRIEELRYVLLSTDRITLMNKSQIVFFITHRYYKDIYNTYSPPNPKRGKNKTKSLEARVEQIISDRNKFAHRQFSFNLQEVVNFNPSDSELRLDTDIGQRGEIVPKPLPLSRKIMDSYIKEIRTVTTIFMKICDEIKDLKRP